MNSFRKLTFLIPLAACGVLTVVYAASPSRAKQSESLGNSYYVYTKALRINDSGVVPIPSRFKWSVETSWRGIDVHGNYLPDSRVMLRLYDPDHNFTALTAQMDLETATTLQQELVAIIVKKLQDPAFQYRPQLYDPKDIPTKEIVGVDEGGTLILENAVKE